MKVFVTGVCGQLGHDVVSEALERGHQVCGSDIQSTYSGVMDESPACSCSYRSLDITDKDSVVRTIMALDPDAVIHCAAWTAVDAAEDPANQKKVMAINADGTRYLAETAKFVDARMMYISTDYIFNGQGIEPWEADCQEFAPLNVYGRSKLAGEQAVRRSVKKHFIVRTAWVFGHSNTPNFIKTMIRVGKTHDTVRVVKDQIGTPTYTRDLARLLVDMIETEKYGTYHATNSEIAPGEFISWYDFCVEIYKQYGLRTEVIPVTTAEYGASVAARPFNSRLDKSKLVKNGFSSLPDWKDAVARYLAEADL